MESMRKPSANTAERVPLTDPKMDSEQFEMDAFPESDKSSLVHSEKIMFHHLHCDILFNGHTLWYRKN